MGSKESAEETAAFFKKNYGRTQSPVFFERTSIRNTGFEITKPFYLGTYHVTRGQFRQFVKDSDYEKDVEKDRLAGDQSSRKKARVPYYGGGTSHRRRSRYRPMRTRSSSKRTNTRCSM